MRTLRETLEFLSSHPDYRDLSGIEGVSIRLRYAEDDNFMGKNVYGEFNRAFLHRIAADMLARAAASLRQERPGFSLLVFDALRPRAVQRVLWSYVVGTDHQGYVANPDRGSVHNYGMAVDLTVVDASGRELDMGTGFDEFVPLSQPRMEEEFLAGGFLTQAQLENRLTLRRAMCGAGFLQLSHEWWHYDALEGAEIRSLYTIVE